MWDAPDAYGADAVLLIRDLAMVVRILGKVGRGDGGLQATGHEDTD